MQIENTNSTKSAGNLINSFLKTTKHPNTNNANIYKYPYINSDAIKNTMDNYRLFRHNYNKSLIDLNDIINKHNLSVKLLKQLTDKQQEKVNSFKSNNNKLFTKEYNVAVDAFCLINGNILRKRRYQRLKMTHENIMWVLTGFYAKQIRMRNAYLLNLNYNTTRALEKLTVNYRSMAMHTIDGVPRLDICTKTVQNYIRRLREAGALLNYEFINSKKPVKLNFNPKILVVFDVEKQKQTTPDNQSFKEVRRKGLHNNSDTTRTLLKRNKKKEIVKNNNFNNYRPTTEENATNQTEFYKNTNSQIEKNKVGPGVFYNKEQNFSEYFQNQIEDDQDFARKLTNKEFSNYEALPEPLLKKEIQYGSLSNFLFALLIKQEIIKYAAKIWANHTVFEGNWLKLIYLFNSEFLVSNNNYVFTKETALKYLIEFKWRIDWAHRWFLKNKNVNALFPYQYFDKNRKLSSEIGFRFTKTKWRQHLKRIENRQLEQKNLKIEAKDRQATTTKQKRAEKAINKFFNGKFTQNQLYDYFKNNLGHDFALQAANLVKTMQKNKNLIN